jgi:site-specific DNA-methyltransferase (adenine-specific)
MRAVARSLAEDGSFWVLIGDEYADHFGLLLKEAGLHRRQWLIWYEAFGVNCQRGFNRCSRHLFWMVKDPARFVFHDSAVLRPSDRQTKYADGRAQPGGKLWDSVWGINPPIPRLVENSRERLPGFPTQLPLALLTAVVGCASDPGDLVLDPFSGSGTTGAAALTLGRRYLGLERNRAYAEQSRLRLQAAAEPAAPGLALP